MTSLTRIDIVNPQDGKILEKFTLTDNTTNWLEFTSNDKTRMIVLYRMNLKELINVLDDELDS